MTDFTQAFQNDQNTYRCCERDQPVKLSRLKAQSHMTFIMRMEEFIQ